MQGTAVSLSSRYRGAVYLALLQQVPCGLLCLLLLDGGRTARVCGIAVLGFWAAAAVIMVSRPESPKWSDLVFLRWGFFPLLALTVLVARLV